MSWGWGLGFRFLSLVFELESSQGQDQLATCACQKMDVLLLRKILLQRPSAFKNLSRWSLNPNPCTLNLNPSELASKNKCPVWPDVEIAGMAILRLSLI